MTESFCSVDIIWFLAHITHTHLLKNYLHMEERNVARKLARRPPLVTLATRVFLNIPYTNFVEIVHRTSNVQLDDAFLLQYSITPARRRNEVGIITI